MKKPQTGGWGFFGGLMAIGCAIGKGMLP